MPIEGNNPFKPLRRRPPVPNPEEAARIQLNQWRLHFEQAQRAGIQPAPRAEPGIQGIGPGDPINIVLDPAWGAPEFAPPPQPASQPKKVRTIRECEITTRLPRFKLNYDSEEEFGLRLTGTVVTVYDQAFSVERIMNPVQCEITGRQGIGFRGMDKDGDRVHIVFNPHGLNFRTPDPGYVTIDGDVYYFTRPPVRIYKQGLNGENTRFIRAGGRGAASVWGRHPTYSILRGFEERPIIQWSPDLLSEEMKAVRLSDRVAVYRSGKKLIVEHKGFALGELKDDEVQSKFPYHHVVSKALNAVGLSFGEVK